MVSYQYTYLLGGILLLVIWLILFFWRKDIRKELIIVSLIFSIFGSFMEFIYKIDWWNPPTITNTIVSPEDFIYNFAIAGIAATIYEAIFKRRLRIRETKGIKRERNLNIIFLLLLLGILFLTSFYILKLNSLFSTIIALFIPTLIIYYKRKDLITDSLASGFLLLITAFVLSSFLGIFLPDFARFLYYPHSSKFLIFQVPWWDIPFYFFAGAFIGPLYEYYQEAKLINLKNN